MRVSNTEVERRIYKGMYIHLNIHSLIFLFSRMSVQLHMGGECSSFLVVRTDRGGPN